MNWSYFLIAFLMTANMLFSQEIDFEFRGAYTRPIKIETLNNAKTMMDLCPGFPNSWISAYHSSEITVISRGTKFSGLGLNDTLSSTQRDYIQKADMGSDIAVYVIYSTSNPVTHEKYLNSISFSLTLIPEIEAEPAKGYPNLRDFIKENTVKKLSILNVGQVQQAIVRFTIDESGEMINANITKTSGIDAVDQMLLKTISNMPKWNAAQNKQGQKVKQEFEFRIGNGVGC